MTRARKEKPKIELFLTPLVNFMSIITETDIIVDGLADTAFPYLDEVFEEFGWSMQTVGVQLLIEDKDISRNIAERLVDAWCIKKEISSGYSRGSSINN